MDLTLIYSMAAVMIGVGVGFLYFLLGRGGFRQPADALEWIGTLLSLGLVVAAGTLLFMALQIQNSSAPQPRGRVASAMEDVALELPADNFSFRMVGSDEPGELAAYQGKVILLNFWATWCAPCLSEMPELNRIHEDYQDKGVVVLTVSDEYREDLLAFNQVLPLKTVSAYIDPMNGLPPSFDGGLTVRPTTYLIDREGVVRRYLLGARNYAFFSQALAPYL